MIKRLAIFISVVSSLFSALPARAACGPTYGADGIAIDSKGDVWITHYEDIRVGKLRPRSGEFAEFLPTTKANADVTTRTRGSSKDGFDYSFDAGFSGIGLDEKRGWLWATQFNTNKIVRFSLKDKSFKEFEVPGNPYARGRINMDAQGNIWMLSSVSSEDGMGMKDGVALKISPQGKVIKKFPAPLREFTGHSMTLDRKGRLWLAQTPMDGKEAELYTLINGRFRKQKLPKVGRYISGLASDSRGSLWFSAVEMNAIGKVSSGKTTLFAIPTEKASPGDIFVDNKDNIWFTESEGHKIGRLSPDGRFREYPLPHEEEWVVTLSSDKDGYIWFSTILNYNLFRLDPVTGAIKEYTVPVPTNWSEDAAAISSVCKVGSKDTTIEEAKVDTLVPLRHPKGYPDAGAPLFEKSCNTSCHTWYRVDKAAQRRSDWTATVDRMIEANGAKFITEAERKDIINYLNANYSIGKDGQKVETGRRH